MKTTFLRSLQRCALAALVGAASMAAQAQAPSTLRVGLAEDPDVLDPTLARTFVGRIVFSALCDKLFEVDEKLAIVPQLAQGHEWSADSKTLTLKLRPGVLFHDGEKLDAAAVKYSIERHKTMAGSNRRGELAPVASVDVVDPLTVRLNLSAPFSPLLAQLADRAGMMVSPKAAQAAGDKFGTRPVCSGPYKFVERVPQDRMVFERFDGYWNKAAVAFDRITYTPVVDATVRLANLKSGQFDFIERIDGQHLAYPVAAGEMLMWSLLEGQRAASFSAKLPSAIGDARLGLETIARSYKIVWSWGRGNIFVGSPRCGGAALRGLRRPWAGAGKHSYENVGVGQSDDKNVENELRICSRSHLAALARDLLKCAAHHGKCDRVHHASISTRMLP